MNFRHKEDRFLARVKMDAVSAQGVWPAQFPTGTSVGHGQVIAAGRIYAHLLAEEMERDRERRRKGIRRAETNRERRARLVGEMWKRLERQYSDDEAVLLLL